MKSDLTANANLIILDAFSIYLNSLIRIRLKLLPSHIDKQIIEIYNKVVGTFVCKSRFYKQVINCRA